MSSDIKICEKPDWVSWDCIHDVIWQAHKTNREKGINMRFPSFSGNEIRERIEDHNGKMFLALCEDIVVGTEAFTVKKSKLWCGNGNYTYLCFAAVLPEYTGCGVYKCIYSEVERVSKDLGLNRVMFDTHEDNKRIIEIHAKNGFRPVAYKNYGDHYNIILVKWLDGCPYSEFRCRVEFQKIKFIVRFKQYLKKFFERG